MSMEWVVTSAESGSKLIDFLRFHCSDHSARQLKAAIENNRCQINGKVERFASARIGKGDRIVFDTSSHVTEKNSISILYEDDDLVIVNKPPGIASQDLSVPKHSNLILVHRLDKETSGALIFAKTEEIYEKMVQLFRKHAIKKQYIAFVEGVVKGDRGAR